MIRSFTHFKKGSTSFYVVIMSALILGIIITSFTLLTLREQNKSVENNLAQSAYNAALAGVEDAKLALSEYYNCINKGKPITEGADLVCQNGAGANDIYSLILASSNELLNSQECKSDSVVKILRRNGIDSGKNPVGGEVFIKESIDQGSSTTQAYTCVQVSPIAPDYRGTINQSTPVRTIPLYQSMDSSAIDHIKISWYSSANYQNDNKTNYLLSNAFAASSDDSPIIPPVLQFSFFQTEKQFYLNTLDEYNTNSTSHRGTVWLKPQKAAEESSEVTTITANQLKTSYDGTNKNSPISVMCHEDKEFFCSAVIKLPSIPNRNSDTMLAAVSLPYNFPETDFSVELYDSTNQPIRFKDAQIIVDSTGRANDVYSRVEARLEYRDIFFPIPEYAIDLSGSLTK